MSSYYENFGFTTTGMERVEGGGYWHGAMMGARVAYSNQWTICMHWIDVTVRWQVPWWHIIIVYVFLCSSSTNIFFIYYTLRPRWRAYVLYLLRCSLTNSKYLQSIFRPGEYSKHGLMCFAELCGNRLFRVVVHSRYRFGISCIDQRFSVLYGCIIVLLAIGV